MEKRYENKETKWLIDKPGGLFLTRRRLEPTPSGRVHSVIYRELFAGILLVALSIVLKVGESFFVSLIQ